MLLIIMVMMKFGRRTDTLPTIDNYMNANDLDLEYPADSSRKQNVKKRNPINIINEECFDKNQKFEKVVSVKQKINFMNDPERSASYIPSKPHDNELLKAATQSNVKKTKSNIDNKPERSKAIDKNVKQKINYMNNCERPESYISSKPNDEQLLKKVVEKNQAETYNDNTSPTENDILRRIEEDPDLWERHKFVKRQSENQLNEDFKRVKLTPPHLLFQNIKLLKDLKMLDTLYGPNRDSNG